MKRHLKTNILQLPWAVSPAAMGLDKTRCAMAVGREGHCDSDPESRNSNTIVFSLSYSLSVGMGMVR